MPADPEAVVAVLARAPLFRGLPEEDLAALREVGRPRSPAKGETLFRQGEPSEGFWFVLSGKVKLAQLSPAGKEQILHVHGPGEPFAEATLTEGARYPAGAEALADSRVLLFPRGEFQKLLGRRPRLAMNLIARLSQRVRQMAALVEDLSLREAPARLARYLLELPAANTSQGLEVRLPMKKGDLAAHLGTRQETLSRVFRKLEDAGLIVVRGGRIVLLSPERLIGVCEGDFPLP